MEIKLHNIERFIYKKLRTNQLLLAISVIISVSVVLIDTTYVYWALYFAFIAALNLPNINKCKQDLSDYKKEILGTTKGTVMDFFPETNNPEENWILFLEVPEKKEIEEYIMSPAPDLKIGTEVEIYYTKLIHVPTKVKLIA